uniref:Uncharacterized protein n=1 Tax=Leersia perrieri TaxID=77586 RepID=A0A0D9WVR1_9ORYZ
MADGEGSSISGSSRSRKRKAEENQEERKAEEEPEIRSRKNKDEEKKPERKAEKEPVSRSRKHKGEEKLEDGKGEEQRRSRSRKRRREGGEKLRAEEQRRAFLLPGTSMLVVGSREDIIAHIANEGPLEDINFRIVDDLPLKEVASFWEMAIEKGNDRWRIQNPELLIAKESAYNFLETRVRSLIRWRNGVDAEIRSLGELVTVLEVEMAENEANPPPIPADYHPRRLHVPRLLINPERGTDHDCRSRSAILQQRLKKNELVGQPPYALYWTPDVAWRRELKARQAFRRMNRSFLKVKMDSLSELRDSLTVGIRSVMSMFSVQDHLGSAPLDYSALFRDVAPVTGYVDDTPLDDNEMILFQEEGVRGNGEPVVDDFFMSGSD